MTHPINGPQPIAPAKIAVRPVEKSKEVVEKSFQQILEGKLKSDIKFSSHAVQRLKARNIDLTSEEMGKLQGAVERAASKGARDSLVLMDNLALVVSVKNRTVITAMDGSNMKENVFTNIDSAVIV